jgi:hypothetical protein
MRGPLLQFLARCYAFGGIALALACASGCASYRASVAWRTVPATPSDAAAFATARRTVSEAFPSSYRATQRAIITVRRQQFVCDGFLAVSPTDGWHLALISTLGLMTDVRVKAGGSSQVMKITPIFQEQWAREYVTSELRWLYTPPLELAPAGRLSDGRLLLEAVSREDGVKASYVCSQDGSRWEELDVGKGPQCLFHAKILSCRTFAGWPQAVPAEFEVQAGTHQLHVRTAALTPTTAAQPEAAR